MQRYFREWNIRTWPKWLQFVAMTGGMVVCFIVAWSFIEYFEHPDAWSKYQQAKMDARTFRSTMCRIEDIIIEETRPNKNKTANTTSIHAFFLLRVLNSTNKQDQFRLAEVPLLHEPGQHSLVNSSLTCFYDPTGVEQAKPTILNLSEAKRTFKRWCFATIIVLITFLLIVSCYIMKLCKKIHRFIESRHRVTAEIAMEPINFD